MGLTARPSPDAGDNDSELCLALDVGGTKVIAALVDRRGEVRTSAESRTHGGPEPEELFFEVTKLLDSLLTGEGTAPVALGVGCPGPIRDGSEVSPINIPAWRGFPLRQRLQERYGLATFLELDTKALALAEGWRGAATGKRNYLAMVVSTGIGGGLVLDGRVIEGRTGNAGHVGHIVVQPGGKPCSCGGRGCLESEASGWAIEAMTGRPPSEAPPEVVNRTGELVGRALASVVSLCDLDLVVVAGSVALGFGPPFFEAASSSLARKRQELLCAWCTCRTRGPGPSRPLDRLRRRRLEGLRTGAAGQHGGVTTRR